MVWSVQPEAGHRGLVLKPAVGRVKVGYMRGPRVCPTFCLLLAG